MSFFADYFQGRIFVINVEARRDRWENCERQFRKFGFSAVRFNAYTGVLSDCKVSGNAGCVASHRALLELIAWHQWPRTLILEDDFDIIYEDFHERFERFIGELPADWDQFFLGGHYGEPAKTRVSKRVMRANRMLTTSSYAITWQHARMIAPYISGSGPIDSLMSEFHRNANVYVMTPRAIVQMPSVSDLQDRMMDNSASMLDRNHEVPYVG